MSFLGEISLPARLRDLARPAAGLLMAALVRLGRWGDRGSASDPAAPRLLVMIFEPQLGAIMATTPLLRALRRAWPRADITVLGSRLVVEVLRHAPYIDRVAGGVHPCRSLPAALWNMGRALMLRMQRPERFHIDWLITTEGARFHPLLGLLNFCLPIRRRAGFATQAALAHYDAPQRYDPAISAIANNLQAGAPLAITETAGEPAMYFDAPTVSRVRRWLANAGWTEAMPLAVFAPEISGQQSTRWRPDRVAAVADRLARDHGLWPVFVGTGNGHALMDEIRQRMTVPAVSLAGQTGIPDLAALFALADLAVTADSGPLHVARTTGVPLVVVTSGWRSPHHWLPLGVDTCVIVARPEHCRPQCRIEPCITPACVEAVTTDEVVMAAVGLLQRYPPLAGRAARLDAGLAGSAVPRDVVGPDAFWRALSAGDRGKST
jgi:ADP-heptose:LPS heptosyltransferase